MKKFDKDIYKERAEILKALAHPVRLGIVDFLSEGEKTVTELMKLLKQSQTNVSKHLSILKRVGIVDDFKEGLNRFYYLKIPCVSDFSVCTVKTLKTKFKLSKKLIKSK